MLDYSTSTHMQHTVIEDEYQAVECLNLSAIYTDGGRGTVPLPIVLDSTIERGFICENVKALYAFSCSIYTYDLIWHINDQILAVLFPSDSIGTVFSRSFPVSAPAYNLTVILSQRSSMFIGEYSLPLTTSILIVQPFNESENEAIPFTVTCQSHCRDKNSTTVCQRKHFNVAGTKNACRIRL